MTHSKHVGGDISHAAGPGCRRLVQDVVNTDALVLGHELVQVLLEQNVGRGDVGEDEINFGLVTSRTAPDNGSDDLEHGRDTSAAGDHAEVAHHVRRVDEGALGALDADRLADSQAGHVLADIARGVGLDQEVEVAGLMVAADRRVGAHNLLGAAIGLCNRSANRDMLADGKAEDRARRGEAEAVAANAVLVL